MHAVFGSLDAGDLARGLGAFVADGILARTEARLTAGPASAATALHVALDLPVFDLDLGGLLVGVGAAVELLPDRPTGRRARASRPASCAAWSSTCTSGSTTAGWSADPARPRGAGDLRWMSARVEVPLTGEPGTAELVLHEATGLGIDRERWVVRVDPDAPTVGAVVPEVRGSALRGRGPAVAPPPPPWPRCWTTSGSGPRGGLDPAGLDRLLLDTATTVRARIAAAPDVGRRPRCAHWSPAPPAAGSCARLDLRAGRA